LRLWVWIFLAGIGADIVFAWHGMAALCAGHLADPDSALRIARILAGIHQGHLVNTVNGVTPEWSRALDILLWLLAAPVAVIIGWPRALFAAGVALGPLCAGCLSVALGFAIRPFAEDRLLWTAGIAALLLPGMLALAAPGAVHEHVLALALTAASIGCANRAWRGRAGYGFLAGITGGFAVWLSPETTVFILLGMLPLLLRWLDKPIAGTITATASGFIDVIGFAWMVDPGPSGYFALDPHRLSIIYVVLGIFLLLAGAALWQLQGFSRPALRRAAGMTVCAGFMAGWLLLFPQLLAGVALAGHWPGLPEALLVASACVYAAWRAVAERSRFWFYIALCALLAFGLGSCVAPLTLFAAAAFAWLLPAALSQLRARVRNGGMAGT